MAGTSATTPRSRPGASRQTAARDARIRRRCSHVNFQSCLCLPNRPPGSVLGAEGRQRPVRASAVTSWAQLETSSARIALPVPRAIGS